MISRISISNFRSHRALTLECGKTHALVGENGTGKTAVLEAIDLATTRGGITSRVSEADFNVADDGSIDIEVRFDQILVAEAPDGYQTRLVPCVGSHLTVKRREQAARGKALSDPLVISKRLLPLVYDDVSALCELTLAEGIDPDELPDKVSETDQGFEIPRKTGRPFKIRRDRLTLDMAGPGFPSVFYFGRSRERQSKTGFNTLLTRILRDLNWRFRKACDLDELVRAWDAYYELVLEAVQEGTTGKVLESLRDRVKRLLGSDLV